MEQLLDTDLIKLAKQGEGRAFDILVQRYQQKITAFVMRYVRNPDVALDVVQNIFFKIYRNLSHFKGDAKFSSWLYRIASNQCIDHLRRQKHRPEISLDTYLESASEPDSLHAGEETYEETLEGKERMEQVRQALGNMPENMRLVLILKVYQELTFEQISEITGEPLSTVKSRLYKALNTLGGLVKQNDFIQQRGLK